MEQLITELAKLGTGWIVAGYMFKLLIAEKDKAVTNSEKTVNSIVDPLKTLQKSIDLLTEIVQKDGKNEKKD